MVQARDEIRELGAEVVFVAFHDPELLTAKMLRSLDLPYLLLLDPARESYARWGLGPATVRAFLSPGLYWAALKETLKVLLGRERSLGTAPRSNQLGGDFVVDRTGRLAYAHRMQSLYDRAPIPDLLAALQEA